MTLHDIWLVVCHHYKSVLLVPVLCALLLSGVSVFASGVIGESYTTSSRLTVTDPTGLVGTASLSNIINVLAQEEAGSIKADDVQISVNPDVATQSVEFVVESGSTERAVETANDLAENTQDKVQVALIEQGDAYLKAVSEVETLPYAEGGTYVASGVTAADRAAALRSCSYTISAATLSETSGSSSVVKYALVGFFGGFFAIVCILALVDSIRRPIKGKNDIAKITDVPVLAEGSDKKSAERLWTNLCFVVDDGPLSSVCVLPVSGGMRTDIVSVLQAVAKKNHEEVKEQDCGGGSTHDALESATRIVECESMCESMSGARTARDADATIVVVRPWVDGFSGVVDALDELQLARARIAGIVLA